jgi:hypothetical protein
MSFVIKNSNFFASLKNFVGYPQRNIHKDLIIKDSGRFSIRKITPEIRPPVFNSFRQLSQLSQLSQLQSTQSTQLTQSTQSTSPNYPNVFFTSGTVICPLSRQNSVLLNRRKFLIFRSRNNAYKQKNKK